MKEVISLIAMAVLCGNFVSAQDLRERDVPENVLKAFQSNFPEANDVEWEMSFEYFNVDFEVDRKDHEAWFDETGTLVKHEEEISKKELPDAVIEAIKNDFASYEIDDVDKITKSDSVTFSISLENYDEDLQVLFSEDGEVLESKRD